MSSFWNLLDKRVKGIEKNVPWHVNDKIKLNNWLKDNNFPCLQIYKTGDINQIEDLFNINNNKFTIKPNRMHSTTGVYPVIKVYNDLFFDLLRHNLINKTYIFNDFNKIYEKCNRNKNLIFFVEEICLTKNNRICPDYKYYTFSNHVGFILRIDRNSYTPFFTIYDHNLNILNIKDIMEKKLGSRFTFSICFRLSRTCKPINRFL